MHSIGIRHGDLKMENILKSPIDAVIKNIAVEKGDTVEKNRILVEFNLCCLEHDIKCLQDYLQQTLKLFRV